MKLVTVKNPAGDVVAVFTAAKKKQAVSAAEMLGGKAEDFPAGLNEFKSAASNLPRGVKGFYSVELFKSGELKRVTNLPLLSPDGGLRVSEWAVDKYGKRAAIANKSEAVRKAHWILIVRCYGPDVDTAIMIAKEFLAEIKAGKRAESGDAI